ncbi:hypothetical protein GCM10010124_16010 [Pilimelia terevasa]|uniref:Uncharacterized protein n=1 Tax=Pilimelia terevasa TaxID=53372 RepID=A0A8J3FH14_9ACTN|nr:hypothetical protein [Pilimelia terevasa]GGK24298.1 hypothetical protein GCM10010124_16010 [Pilimelia terevasa]
MPETADPPEVVGERAIRFVTWARAWRAGLAAYDDVADVIADGEEHLLADSPGTWRDLPLRQSLAFLSKVACDEIRLVLPVPGDPTGLPGPGRFTDAAVAAREAVVAGGYGLVPSVQTHTSGSGDEFHTVVWRVYQLPAAPAPPPLTAADAEADLSAALAETTTALTRLDVARWRPGLASALEQLRRPGSGHDLPPGFTPRSRRLYARARVLHSVLALAAEDAPGGAVNAHEANQRDAALRPLTTACRHALTAACNAPLAS